MCAKSTCDVRGSCVVYKGPVWMCIVLGAFGEYPPVVSLQPHGCSVLLTLLLKADTDSVQSESPFNSRPTYLNLLFHNLHECFPLHHEKRSVRCADVGLNNSNTARWHCAYGAKYPATEGGRQCASFPFTLLLFAPINILHA